MFIDRLLDNWNNYIKDRDLSTRLKLFGDNPPDWDVIKDALIHSIPFDVTNVSDYLDERCSQKPLHIISDIPNVRPPYLISWYEFIPRFNPLGKVYMQSEDGLKDVTGNPEHITKTFGVLITEHDRITIGDRIPISALIFREGLDCTIHLSLAIMLGCHEDGTLFSDLNNLSQNKYSSAYYQNAPNGAISSFYQAIIIRALMGISFLHCKNIVIRSTEPSIKLQHARVRKGKLPLFTFKTLEIKPMTKILREEGESETKGLARALHICRGHFKDFQQGPGLGRGHAHGLYWWDSQVRGNREVGAVIKDYKVSPFKRN
jgi:hypothetical protein